MRTRYGAAARGVAGRIILLAIAVELILVILPAVLRAAAP